MDRPERLWLLYLVAVLAGALGRIAAPAENAFLLRLVGEEGLTRANSLNSLNDSIARLIGPGIGALLFATAGLAAVALLDAASFAIAALLVSRVRQDGRPERVDDTQSSTDFGHPLAVFVRELAGRRLGHPPRRRPARGARLHVPPRHRRGCLRDAPGAVRYRGDRRAGVGIRTADRRTGGRRLAGSLLTASVFGGVSARRLLILGAIGLGFFDGLLFLYPAVLPSLLPGLVIIAAAGLPAAAAVVGWRGLLQLGVQDRLRGRVFATMGAALSLSMIVTSGAAGLLATRVPVVPLLLVDAAVYPLGALIVALAGRRAPSTARPSSVVVPAEPLDHRDG